MTLALAAASAAANATERATILTLGEALCHSQTRARKAEEGERERERVRQERLRREMALNFAYRQYITVLQVKGAHQSRCATVASLRDTNGRERCVAYARMGATLKRHVCQEVVIYTRCMSFIHLLLLEGPHHMMTESNALRQPLCVEHMHSLLYSTPSRMRQSHHV